jgi:hypothetical protein
MMQEAELAVLTIDLPTYGLKAGDVGTVAMVHGRDGYEIEFMTLDGETIAVVSVDAAQCARSLTVRSLMLERFEFGALHRRLNALASSIRLF